MENIITTKDLNLWYGAAHALKNIDMEIPEKKITALIGPSGCGKSTCLKTLNRMNDLVENCRIEGKLTLSGIDMYKEIDVNILKNKPCPKPYLGTNERAINIAPKISVATLYSTN